MLVALLSLALILPSAHATFAAQCQASKHPINVPFLPCLYDCFDGWKLGYNHLCYKSLPGRTYAQAQGDCATLGVTGVELANNYCDVRLGSILMGIRAPWVTGIAGPTGFQPPVPVRPGSTRTVGSNPANQCLAFQLGRKGSFPSRFKAGPCNNKCPALCCVHASVKGGTSPNPGAILLPKNALKVFVQEGQTYWLQAYLGAPKMNFRQVKEFCECQGGFLPWLKVEDAFDATVEAFCDRYDWEFWVNAYLTWDYPNKKQLGNLKWIKETGVLTDLSNVYNGQIFEATHPQNKFFTRHCGGPKKFDLVPNQNGKAKFYPVCQFLAPIPNFP